MSQTTLLLAVGLISISGAPRPATAESATGPFHHRSTASHNALGPAPSPTPTHTPGPYRTVTPAARATADAHATRSALAIGDRFRTVPPIWVAGDSPAEHEVALLRGRFRLTHDEPRTELLVWADTRYAAWLDGRLLGRGPARFSAITHSYDVLPVPALDAGEHVLALRAQWAPNQRRSVSQRPQALARLQRRPDVGEPSSRHVLAQTSSRWRAQRSSAWLRASVPVHALDLIGPSEVLDLRLLPEDWTDPAFDDSAWPAAVALYGPSYDAVPRLLRRDVPMPADAPMVPRLLAQGRLSPDAALIHVPATPGTNPEPIEGAKGVPADDASGARSIEAPRADTTAFTTTLVVTRSGGTEVTLTTLLGPPDGRSLSEPGAPGVDMWTAPPTTIDGLPVTWSPQNAIDAPVAPVAPNAPDAPSVDEGEHDHVSATLSLETGEHQLRVAALPADGLALSVAPAEIAPALPTIGPVPHPGRRLLLARPEPEPAGTLLHPEVATTPSSQESRTPTTSPEPDPPLAVAVAVARHANGIDLRFEHAPSYVVLDLGQTRIGRLGGRISGPAGATIDIGWDERLAEGSAWPLPHPGSKHAAWSQVDSLTLDGRERELDGLDARSGRYVLIAAWQAPVVIRDLVLREAHVPLRQRGWLHTGDEGLDALWQAGADTVRVNGSDVYADPWRERGLWWGDAWAAQRAGAVVFGDDTLRRRGLRLMAEPLAEGKLVGFAPRGDQSRLPDYAMLWLLDLAEQVRFGEDDRLLAELWTAVVALMDQLTSETRGAPSAGAGLLDLAEGPWHETSFIDWAAGEARYGTSGPLNSIYVEALRAAAMLAERRGDAERALAWSNRADTAAAALRSTLWQADERRFNTTRVGERVGGPSAHAQAWPLAHGLVPAEDVADVAIALDELLAADTLAPGGRDLPTVEIYGFHWVLEAFGRTGRVDLGLAALERWHGPLLDRGLRTWPESWMADTRWDAALSHGWGAAPTVFLTRWLLGARRVGPRDWRLRPGWTGSVEVEGALPLPEGNLRARWTRVECRVGVVEVEAPAGTRGALELRHVPGMRLWVDGRRVEVSDRDGQAAAVAIPFAPPSTADDAGASPGLVLVPLPAGSHRVVAMPLGRPLCRD